MRKNHKLYSDTKNRQKPDDDFSMEGFMVISNSYE